MEPKKLKVGDPCPACHGELKAAYVPSDEEFRKAIDRENPQSLPPRADTATAETRAELGALYRCTSCGYQARFKDDEAAEKQRAKKKRDAEE